MNPSILINDKRAMPSTPFPIMMIGAGGIVHDGHLPAYRKAGWQVAGIVDLNKTKAEQLAAEFMIPKVFSSIKEMVDGAAGPVVFDVAVPASAITGVLNQLPNNAVVLIQKPMGENIQEAAAILALCKKKNLTAAVNFQMKFIPAVNAARNLIASGALGELHDMEIRMNIYHPWHLWKFLYGLPRMEMLYHSIHYMDLLKDFFGLPVKVYAKTLKHPKMMQLASTRSIIFFEYDNMIKAHINTNHGHEFGLKHQDSFIKFECTRGAIITTLGMNINYPEGIADTFEYVVLKEGEEPEWQSVKLEDSWFPDAFIWSMADLMCYAEGSSNVLVNSVDNAFQTMQIVEAAYESSESGGTKINW